MSKKKDTDVTSGTVLLDGLFKMRIIRLISSNTFV